MTVACISEIGTTHEGIRLKPTSIFPIASLLRTEFEGHDLFLGTNDFICIPKIGGHTESYLLTQAVRQTAFDDTGIVPHLLGVAHNPQETLMYMLPAATNALSWLKAQGVGVANETLNALLHNGPCSIRSLDNLDEMWGSIVTRVKDTAFDADLAEPNSRMTLEARMFKEANIASLRALREKQGLIELVNRRLVVDEIGGNLIDVAEELTIPVVPEDQVAKLLEILPDIFNRKVIIPTKHYPLEVQILRELGKVGNDFTRVLISLMKEKQLIRQMSGQSS
jgi:hypothetical protein